MATDCCSGPKPWRSWVAALRRWKHGASSSSAIPRAKPRASLQRHPPRRQRERSFRTWQLSHIGAIQILSIGVHITDPGPVGDQGVSMVAGSSLQTRFGIRFVQNPRYLGFVGVTPVPPSPAQSSTHGFEPRNRSAGPALLEALPLGIRARRSAAAPTHSAGQTPPSEVQGAPTGCVRRCPTTGETANSQLVQTSATTPTEIVVLGLNLQ